MSYAPVMGISFRSDYSIVTISITLIVMGIFLNKKPFIKGPWCLAFWEILLFINYKI
jgi:hypothetical protein